MTRVKAKKYKLILFDADDTLFDFQKAEHYAFHKTLNSHGIVHNNDTLLSTYQEISSMLWEQLERDEISKNRLKVQRFETLFQKYKIDSCPSSASETYLDALSEKVFFVNGAKELVEKVRHVFEIGIITNGIETVQKRRLAKSGIEEFVSIMVVSEECGYNKPDRRIFDHTLRKTKFSPNETLMIGDRLETDILGAKNAEIDSCWFNPNKCTNSLTQCQPTYEISRLNDLNDILF